ncbi:MAG: glycosyltransferase family 4 protein [Candidatus Magasanikbacteria bacterium]|nr:glycosyltransferase family 4 protein [Candidatus Magasanikbacteria bacterium]
MKLLVLTQKVDLNDSNLGSFHAWLQRLSEQVDHLYVVCLQKGEDTLNTDKVTILSLGKERGAVSTVRYAARFYAHLWRLRGEYDKVLVHMNPEYAIMGGLFWRLAGKKVLLWYTHKAVNLKLRLAEKFVTKIFTASKESFRLPSKKVEVVGHGVNMEEFATQKWLRQLPNYREQILLLIAGRVAPSKDLETPIRAVAALKHIEDIPPVFLDVIGSPILDVDYNYKEKLESFKKELHCAGNVRLNDSRSYQQMSHVYQTHHILIHTSRTGSMDKVVLEALAAGRIVVTSSEAYRHLDGSGFVFWFPPGGYQELANTIEKIYKAGILVPNQKAIEYVKKNHNLDTLVGKIMAYFSV